MTIVDLTDFFPFTWIVHFVRAFVVFNISHTVLKNKYNTFITFISIMTAGMIYSYLNLTFTIKNADVKDEVLIMICYYAILFAVVCLVTSGKLFTKLFSIIFSLTAYLSFTFIYEILKNLLVSNSNLSGLNKQVLLADLFGDALFVFAGSFVWAFIIKIINSKTKNNISYRSKFSLLLLFPAMHLASGLISYIPYMQYSSRMLKDYYPKETTEILLTVFTIICMVIDIFIIFFIDYVEKIEENNIKKDREIVKNTMDYHQMLMMKQEKQEFRKIKHDFANIITTAKGFIEINKPEKALHILSNTNEDLIGLAGFSICSNETINTVLYIKKIQAEKSNIDLNIEIEENAAVLIDDYDLCRLLHNLIDNEMNAVSQLDVDRCCKIFIKINDEILSIKTENKYRNFKTKHSKKSDEHGNGTGIIKSIVSKYNGKYACNQFNGVWNAETLLDNKKLANSTPPPEFWADFKVMNRC